MPTAVVSTGDAFAEPVLELTGGVGADVVLDGGGATTFHASMNVLRRHGLLLYYGPLIGEVPVVTMRDLPRRIKISYPVFSDHVPTCEALLRPSAELFGLVRQGVVSPGIGRRHPLEDAVQAHRDIESRTTSAKLPLVP